MVTWSPGAGCSVRCPLPHKSKVNKRDNHGEYREMPNDEIIIRIGTPSSNIIQYVGHFINLLIIGALSHRKLGVSLSEWW